jgi:2-succinyl-5-enolpyruvyl-6-hydroxy-3-cyclohexene-1-carboxylate synthase
VDEVAERIAASPRGLIVAGRQGDLALGEPVAELAKACGYPILAEPTSQLRWGPHDRSRIVSAYDVIARGRPDALAPELVIRVGDMPTSKALRQWLASIEGLRQVVIDPTAQWKEPTRRAETVLRADPAAVAEELRARLAPTGTPLASVRTADDWAEGWLAADRAAAGATARVLGDLDQLSEPGLWSTLAAALSDGDQVLAASSMPVRDQEAFMPPGRARVRFIANRGANGIDGLTSTAAGASVAGGRTWAVLGDLALLHDLGGLAAARQAHDLRLLVIDNGGGGIFHFLPQAEALGHEEFEALLGTPSGSDIERILDAHGIEVARPSDPGELKAALEGEARAILIRTDRSQNLELHRRLTERATAALLS